MKTLKTKVILSAVVLLFALVATIGSTFAWFTVATTVQVSSMEMNVNAEDSILIRMATVNGALLGTENVDDDLLDASQYKTVLTTGDIDDYYDYTDFRLSPVTALQPGYLLVDPQNLYNLENLTDFTRPLIALVPAEDRNLSDGRYIELNFYLYSQSALTLNIGVDDVVIESAAGNTLSQVAVEDAVRLGIWKAGTKATTEGSLVASSDEGFIFGNSGTTDYGFTFVTGLPGYAGDTPAVGDFNVLSNATTLAAATSSVSVVSHPSNVETFTATTTNRHNPTGAIFTLSQEVPTLVKVVIYVEGWDIDTTNAIISAAFNISFNFKKLA